MVIYQESPLALGITFVSYSIHSLRFGVATFIAENVWKSGAFDKLLMLYGCWKRESKEYLFQWLSMGSRLQLTSFFPSFVSTFKRYDVLFLLYPILAVFVLNQITWIILREKELKHIRASGLSLPVLQFLFSLYITVLANKNIFPSYERSEGERMLNN